MVFLVNVKKNILNILDILALKFEIPTEPIEC